MQQNNSKGRLARVALLANFAALFHGGQQLRKKAGVSMLKSISDQRDVLLQTKTNGADR